MLATLAAVTTNATIPFPHRRNYEGSWETKSYSADGYKAHEIASMSRKSSNNTFIQSSTSEPTSY